MKYIDLHCDTATVCYDNNYSLNDCPLQVNFQKLKRAECLAQCFAVFTDGATEQKFWDYLNFVKSEAQKYGYPIFEYSDFKRAEKAGRTGCILTVENLGFAGADVKNIRKLKEYGVKMASLVWNNKNLLASPNLCLPDFEKRNREGLTRLGREFAEEIDENKIIIDISHLSDGGAEEILKDRKIPVVASHSNAAGVCNWSRNLTDCLIKKIADCGGVVGINFCMDFLGGDTFPYILKHVKRLIDVGGEDVIALGSDFDGIPPCKDLETCDKLSKLFEYLSEHINIEKLLYKNFLRVFKEVC